jgi:putative membrane protein insertion efficiency factor
VTPPRHRIYARRVLCWCSTWLVRAVLVPIRFYQRWISPGLAPRCRFLPSCSAYAVESLLTYGPFRGSWLAARRLLRCHPWNPGGLDPVPSRVPTTVHTEPPQRPRPTASRAGTSAPLDCSDQTSTGPVTATFPGA